MTKNQDYELRALGLVLNINGGPRPKLGHSEDNLDLSLVNGYFEGDSKTLDLVDAFGQVNKRGR